MSVRRHQRPRHPCGRPHVPATVPAEPSAAGWRGGGEAGRGPGRRPGRRASHLLTESAVEQQSKSPSEFLSGAYPASPRGTLLRGGGGLVSCGEKVASEAAPKQGRCGEGPCLADRGAHRCPCTAVQTHIRAWLAEYLGHQLSLALKQFVPAGRSSGPLWRPRECTAGSCGPSAEMLRRGTETRARRVSYLCLARPSQMLLPPGAGVGQRAGSSPDSLSPTSSLSLPRGWARPGLSDEARPSG